VRNSLQQRPRNREDCCKGFLSWFLDDRLQITKFILGIVKDRSLNSSHGSKYLLQLWMSRARTGQRDRMPIAAQSASNA
jgi:hypothetical protein